MCEVLKHYRERAGLSQEALGARIGYHQTVIGKIERGERRLDVVELIKISEALNINPVAFMADLYERLKEAKQLPPPN